jgi:DNA polymerase-3 subunit alpha
VREEELTDRKVLALKHLVADHAGSCTMEMQVTAEGKYQSTVIFGDRFQVNADEACLLALEKLFRPGAARLI